jgi:hypothetical protein
MSDVVNSLDTLFPPFREQTEKFIKLVEPLDFFIYETYRSFERQMECYKEGRELQNGIWIVVNPKAVRTKAKPGMSLHAYGLAFDSIVDGDATKAGIQWSWSDTYKTRDGRIQPVQWKKMGSISKSVGLEWAGNWISFAELPHSQNRFGLQVSELYPILIGEGIEAVWKKVMIKVPATTNTVVVPIAIPVAATIKPMPIPVAAAEDLDVHTNTNLSEKNSGVLGLIVALVKAILSVFTRKKKD